MMDLYGQQKKGIGSDPESSVVPDEGTSSHSLSTVLFHTGNIVVSSFRNYVGDLSLSR